MFFFHFSEKNLLGLGFIIKTLSATLNLRKQFFSKNEKKHFFKKNEKQHFFCMLIKKTNNKNLPTLNPTIFFAPTPAPLFKTLPTALCMYVLY